MMEATNDVQDAYMDMIERLERLKDDKVKVLERERDQVNQALDRSVFDKKQVCYVLFALRVDFINHVQCEEKDTTKIKYDTTDSDIEWRIYEGLFDDFHYDIGHGKGLGEGTIDQGPIVDGFGNGMMGPGFFGDSQTSFGAPVRTEEKPRFGF